MYKLTVLKGGRGTSVDGSLSTISGFTGTSSLASLADDVDDWVASTTLTSHRLESYRIDIQTNIYQQALLYIISISMSMQWNQIELTFQLQNFYTNTVQTPTIGNAEALGGVLTSTIVGMVLSSLTLWAVGVSILHCSEELFILCCVSSWVSATESQVGSAFLSGIDLLLRI